MKLIAMALALALTGAACGGANRVDDSTAGIGEPVDDGQFTFTVVGFACGDRQVERGIVSFDATGVYCLLDLRVANTGDAGRRFVAGSQRLIDSSDRILEFAQRETLLVNTDGIGSEINPGLALDVTVVFDVADPDAITHAELHDSPLSRGVRVSLEEG